MAMLPYNLANVAKHTIGSRGRVWSRISQASFVAQNAGDADEQGGSGDHANGVQRSGSGVGRNAPKGGRGRPARGRVQMRGDMGMGAPMAPMGGGMMGGTMPGHMFVLAPGKTGLCMACKICM